MSWLPELTQQQEGVLISMLMTYLEQHAVRLEGHHVLVRNRGVVLAQLNVGEVFLAGKSGQSLGCEVSVHRI